MARNLALKTNVEPADSDYPYGKIKDDSGVGDGTPVNELVYGDMHQFFARMFAKSGLVYNNLPDSDYSDFQFFEAAQKLWKNFTGIRRTAVGLTLNFDDTGKLIHVESNVSPITIVLPFSEDINDFDSITIVNNSNYQITINSNFTDTILSSGSISLYKTGDFIEFVLDKSNTDWIVSNRKITITPPSPVLAKYTTITNVSTTALTPLKLNFPTEVTDIDGQFTSGTFTPKQVGFYKFDCNLVMGISASVTETLSLLLYKNGAILDRTYWTLDNYLGGGNAVSGSISVIINVTNITDTYTLMIQTINNQTVFVDGNINYSWMAQ